LQGEIQKKEAQENKTKTKEQIVQLLASTDRWWHRECRHSNQAQKGKEKREIIIIKTKAQSASCEYAEMQETAQGKGQSMLFFIVCAMKRNQIKKNQSMTSNKYNV